MALSEYRWGVNSICRVPEIFERFYIDAFSLSVDSASSSSTMEISVDKRFERLQTDRGLPV